jgi:radical SAM protein with 4Fe4S-binding SPASM domain
MHSRADYERMLALLDRTAKSYGIKGALGIPNLECLFDTSRYKHLYKGTCTGGVDWLVLDPSGRVRYCNHSPTVLGDLRQQDLAAIWEHPLLVRLRNRELMPDECRSCDLARTCVGGCRAAAELCTGDLCGPDPFMRACREEEKQ